MQCFGNQYYRANEAALAAQHLTADHVYQIATMIIFLSTESHNPSAKTRAMDTFEKVADWHGVINCSLVLRTSFTSLFLVVNYVWYHVPRRRRLTSDSPSPASCARSHRRDARTPRIAQNVINLC